MTRQTQGNDFSASTEAVRREFSRRLRLALSEKGWNQSELARRASKFMADGKLGKDLISRYVKGETLPNPPSLNAICKALDKQPNDLVSPRDRGLSLPDFEMRATREGRTFLRVNKECSLATAIEIVQLLQKDT